MGTKFFTENPTLVNNLVLVDGLTRTGKFFLAKLISGLNNIEFFQYSFFLDYLSYMSKLNAITEDGSISLLKSVVDQSCYDQSIGRNLNLRFDDRSSIHNSPEADRYILRSKSEYDREKIVEYLSDEDRIHLFVVHNNLANADIIFKAFPDFRMIHLLRNPIDLVYSWMNKDYGKTEMNSKVDLFKIGIGPGICGKNVSLPWWVYPIKNEYERINQTDRIIVSIKTIITLFNKAFKSLSNDYQKQIMFLKYEYLVENTHIALDDISKFLGSDKSKFMDEIIARENCPSVIDVDQRIKKKNMIFSKATNKYYEILVTLEKRYVENNNFYLD